MEEVRTRIKSDAEGLETLYVAHDGVYSRYPRSVVETHPKCAVGCGEDGKISLVVNHDTDVQKAMRLCPTIWFRLPAPNAVL